MKEFRNFLRKQDYFLIITTILLVVFGLVMIFSATRSVEGSRHMLVQGLAFILGLIGMFLMAGFDYENYDYIAKYMYAASLLILVFVLCFGQGKDETGANSWIRFGSIGIQPSELVKISFCITFSIQLAKNKETINEPRTLGKLLLHFIPIILLVILQNDTGTALVFACMFIVMLLVAGLSFKYVLAGVGAFSLFVPLAWFFLMKPYQKERILVFLNPERDASGAGYQVLQSKIAIGSGEFSGRGFMQGPQNQLEMLPEKFTDFIYGVVGEEFGFIGTTLILLLLVILICRCVYVAMQAKDNTGCFMAVGIGAMFAFHTFENILMCIGLMPVTGIPLPFVSYGGSSMLTNCLAVGLVLSVWYRRRTLRF